MPSPRAYLEVLLINDRYDVEAMDLVGNVLEPVPVRTDEQRQIVRKAVSYYEDGLTPFDAFHAATADTYGYPILSADSAYEAVDSERIPFEPT